jgi:plasmid stabilization system protein ParE
MPYQIRITARALREIDEALEWLAERAPAAASRWYEQLSEAIDSLVGFPELCGLAPESEWYPGELRQLLHGKRKGMYRILLEIREDVVIILRVRHSARALLGPDEL